MSYQKHFCCIDKWCQISRFQNFSVMLSICLHLYTTFKFKASTIVTSDLKQAATNCPILRFPKIKYSVVTFVDAFFWRGIQKLRGSMDHHCNLKGHSYSKKWTLTETHRTSFTNFWQVSLQKLFQLWTVCMHDVALFLHFM